MLNMLIVEDNPEQCKQIANTISQRIKNVKLYSYLHTIQETLELINNGEIDFLLLDLKLPDGSGAKIIQYLEHNNILKYQKSIIIVSGQYEMIAKVIHSKYIFDIIYKPVNFEKLILSINNLISLKEINSNLDNLKSKIIAELEQLHYNISHNGTRYLIDAILQVYLMGEDKDNLNKDIYPIIAHKYNTTINNVKCDILKASNVSFYECENNKFQKYFNLVNTYKPNTKTIIYTILNKINYHNF